MSDTPIGQEEVVQETPVEENPQEGMPTSDKPADKEEALANSKNPERTKAYIDRLEEENKRLKESQPRSESVFDSLRPQMQAQPQAFGNLTPQQVGDISQRFTDQEGYLDENALSKALRDANERAARAEVAAQQSRDAIRQFEEKEQVRATHSKFPQLDQNSDSFDPRFFELVRNEMVGQMMRGEQDYLKAAEKVSMILNGKPVEKKPDQKANLEQINADVKSQRTVGVDANLLSRVQRGEKGALAELLRQTGN